MSLREVKFYVDFRKIVSFEEDKKTEYTNDERMQRKPDFKKTYFMTIPAIFK